MSVYIRSAKEYSRCVIDNSAVAAAIGVCKLHSLVQTEDQETFLPFQSIS
jgi:hypothetical protein